MTVCPKCGYGQFSTLETLLAGAHCEISDDGEIQYEGYTAVSWDSQETVSPLSVMCRTCSETFGADQFGIEERW